MREGWTVQLVAAGGEVQLEYVGPTAADWYGDGVGGTALGTLAEVIAVAAGADVDPLWAQAAHAAVLQEAERDSGRVGLVVARGESVRFHATRSVNRESITRHGLDWARMATDGIAGSTEPEHQGIFLCVDIESARWFAGMARGGPVDIWQVRADGLWLISDPNSSNGLDTYWAIATEPIDPKRLRLVERDL